MSKETEQQRGLLSLVLSGVAIAALLGGCGGSGEDLTAEQIRTEVMAVAPVEDPPRVRVLGRGAPGELVVRDLERGEGATAREGDRLTVQFVAERIDGEPFESTWDAGRRPFSFRLGGNEASPGWEQGVPGMRVGGRRQLIVPPQLSSRFGAPASSDPDDSLVYVIELIRLQRPGAPGRGEPRLKVPAGQPPAALQVHDLIVGDGAEAERGDLLTVEYVADRWDGTRFTNSWERAKPFRFELGAKSVWINPGWQRGLEGMRVGGRRQLVIPPALQYEGGAPPGVGPEETLVYVIDLVSIGDEETADEAAIAKAAFVRRADGICAAAQRRIATGAIAVIRRQMGPQERLRTELGMVEELVIPALESEVERIRALGAPSGDEDKVADILAAIEGVIEEAKTEPETFVQAGGEYVAGAIHFAEANKLARAYGLKTCPAG